MPHTVPQRPESYPLTQIAPLDLLVTPHLVRASIADHPPLVENDDVRSHRENDRHVVLNDQEGRAPLPSDFGHQINSVTRVRWRESTGRFIQHEQLRLEGQCYPQLQLLLIPVR